MRVVTDSSGLEAAGIRGRSSVLVPTMGALHPGHAALIRRGAKSAQARALPGGCVVSIFVNPAQFNDHADLEAYPRSIDADLELCRAAGASVVFVPALDDVYPPGITIPQPDLPPAAMSRGLEDAGREGHFEGVCRVVRRLFDLTEPAAAVFGEKDWQQLAVVQAMTARDTPGISIIAAETVRDPDGLAMSSRNTRLPPPAREQALCLIASLRAAQREDGPAAAENAMRATLRSGGITDPAYAVVRDAATLGPVRLGEPARALVAAEVAGVRLLDNLPWPATAVSPG